MAKRAFIFIYTFILLSGLTVSASISRIGDSERFEGNLTASDDFDNKGIINGDVMVYGARIKNTGDVSGDFIGFSFSGCDISGSVGGNVRTASGNLRISSQVYKNITVFTGDAYFTPQARIRGSTYLACGKARLYGVYEKNLFIYGQNITLGGEYKGNVTINGGSSNKIIIEEGASFHGRFIHHGSIPLENPPANYEFIKTDNYKSNLSGILIKSIFIPTALFLFVLIINKYFKEVFEKSVKRLKVSFIKCFLYGLLNILQIILLLIITLIISVSAYFCNAPFISAAVIFVFISFIIFLYSLCMFSFFYFIVSFIFKNSRKILKILYSVILILFITTAFNVINYFFNTEMIINILKCGLFSFSFIIGVGSINYKRERKS